MNNGENKFRVKYEIKKELLELESKSIPYQMDILNLELEIDTIKDNLKKNNKVDYRKGMMIDDLYASSPELEELYTKMFHIQDELMEPINKRILELRKMLQKYR